MSTRRLGHKIQGVLCDGQSNELVGSTVVNCLKIDEGNPKMNLPKIQYFYIVYLFNVPTNRRCFLGTIHFLREGCVPATKVQQIFERVKNSML